MTFLPVVARELRVASRRGMTYWSRFFTAAIVVVIGLFVYLNSRQLASHQLGTELFGIISGAAFLYCLGVGVRSTADCLSEEKRDGTLGLLFLTDLKGYDVVGGKLVATSLNSFYGLLAIFPVLAIPLLMGGMTNGELWRMALVLANTFFLSLAVGMFMSSLCTSPRKAMAGTVVVMLLLTLGEWLCEIWFTFLYHSPLRFAFNLFNPCIAFATVWDAGYASSIKVFWWSCGLLHGLSWVLLGIASFIVPRSWQDKTPGTQKLRWRERWHRWSYGDAGERLVFRRRLLDINAFFWLAGRARLKPAHVWTVLFLEACLWMWGALAQGKEWLNPVVYLLTALVLNTTLKIWVASEAGRRLGEDRKMGSLELLLSTPLSVPDILRGQFLALKRQFLGPLAAVLVVEVFFLFATLQGGQNVDERGPAAAFGVTMMVMLVADLWSLAVVAMWASLTAKNPNRTTGMAVRRILVLPWIVNFAVLILSSIFFSSSRSPDSPWLYFLGLYICTAVVTNCAFGLTAWRRLNDEFREVATQRFTAVPSWLKVLLNREKYAPTPSVPPPAAP